MSRYQLRFYSRDRGPDERFLGFPVIIGLMTLAGMFFARPLNYTGTGIVIALMLAYTLAYLVAASVIQIEYGPYSYETMLYIGASLFALACLISHIHVMIGIRGMDLDDPQVLNSILYSMTGSSRTFMLLSAPFILIYSGFLIISNVALIRRQGLRPANSFGILLAVFLLGGEVFVFLMNMNSSGSMEEVMVHDLLVNLFASVYLYFECMLMGLIITNSIVTRYEPDKDKDFVLILGCGLNRDGTPSPLLKGRIERALRFYNDQIASGYKAPILVASGGQGKNEAVPESTAIRNYLMEKGVPSDHVLEEDDSTSTRENMNFSWIMIDKPEIDEKVVFATTNYHVFRSGMMALKAGVKAEGISAETRWYYWPNATVREFLGLLNENRMKHFLAVLALVLVYSGLIVISFYI